MDYIKNIYANEKNQLYIRTQIETHLREKFNINIDNIPNINTQVQEYMYKAYSNFKKNGGICFTCGEIKNLETKP